LIKINAAWAAGRQHANMTAMEDAELVARYDSRVPRYTSYPTAPHFSAAVGADAYAAWLAALPAEAPLSLYLHVPFCDRLCLYCGCNTGVVRQEGPRRAYAALLERELRMVAGCIGRRAGVGQVHWGGGTPTTLPADCLTGIMALIRDLFHLLPDAEVAIEVDPTALPPDRLEALAGMGVTRASLGVQDLDPGVQAAIGRVQTYEATEDCARSLRALGIGSLNLDLIYGLPRQTEESVVRTARRALDLDADRVAVFGYAHVPWMKRHQALIPEETLPTPPQRFVQQRAIAQVLEADGGYLPVGLDHYARPGDALAIAAETRHLHRSFQGYTTDAAPALIGIGASSIGTLPQGYVQNASGVPAYTQAIREGRLATARGVELSGDDRLRRDVIERIMCDLRADLVALAAVHAADPSPLLASADGLGRFEADGLVRWDGQRVEVTEAGRPFVRSVAAVFDTYLVENPAVRRHANAV
jgi:oxygen-independent coproporphyrinogen-3 oxidase